MKHQKKIVIKLIKVIALSSIILLLITIRLDDQLMLLINESINKYTSIAPYIILLLYIISAPLLLPTFYLTIISALTFGPFFGTIVDVLGNTFGSTIAFCMSRYLLHTNNLNKLLKKYDLEEYKIKDWKLNALLRTSFIVPSGLLGYFFGLTKMSFNSFITSTFIFSWAPSAALTYFTLQIVNRENSLTLLNIVILINIFTVPYLIKKYLNKNNSKKD